MNRNKGSRTRVLQLLMWIIGVSFFLIWGLQVYVSYKIPSLINNKLPQNMELYYEEMDVNILGGNIGVDSLNYKFYNKRTDTLEVEIVFGALELKGLDFWELWRGKTFNSDKVKVLNTHVTCFDGQSGLKNFSIEEGTINISEFKTDTVLLRQKIPFSYDSISFGLNGLFLNLSTYENLTAKSVVHTDHNMTVEGFKISSKFSRDVLSRKLKQERDHIELDIPKVSLNGFYLKTDDDNLQVSVRDVVLLHPDLKLFRDKLLKDDTKQKPLYGEQLNNLPIKVNVDAITVEDAFMSYAERIERGVTPVSITFNGIGAKINNLSNTNTLRTKIEVNAFLMGEAPIQLLWGFNRSKPGGYFNASAMLKNLKVETINPFLEAQAKVRAKGHIHEMYFTISGNDFKSHGDMKMKYEDFEFSILDEDRLGIDKTLTMIVNLITNDGSKTDENGYRYGNIEVERERTRSFFNYLWLNTKDGLKNTVIGNGKK